MDKIEFKGNSYPAWQASGFAARFAFPFAEEVCDGEGLDIGCMKYEWAFLGAEPIDISFDNGYSAMNLPSPVEVDPESIESAWDYIFSSHCLEHLPDWVKALDYWHTRLKTGGVVFLYLPDHSQVYWRSWHNRKHIHNLTPEIVGNYFKDQPEMWEGVMVSNVDLNSSFICIAYKK